MTKLIVAFRNFEKAPKKVTSCERLGRFACVRDRVQPVYPNDDSNHKGVCSCASFVQN